MPCLRVSLLCHFRSWSSLQWIVPLHYYQTNFYAIIKHRNNVRKGIEFDQKENYEVVTSTTTDFRWRWVTTIDNFFHRSVSWRTVEDCRSSWEDWTWRKWGMEQENGERICAFGVLYSDDMSTWGRHFVLADARCLRPEVTYFAGKKLKIDRSVKMPWHRLSMGVARSKWWAPAPTQWWRILTSKPVIAFY